MGPRLRSRGIPSTVAHRMRALELQWGRDFAVAESASLVEARAMLAVLQWGRDFAVAESTRRRRRHRPRRSFNGAATSQSRNRTVCRSLRAIESGLQWGRDFAVAESKDGTGPARSHRCFNGAATSQSRNRADQAAELLHLDCFNGAATSQSRNLARRQRIRRQATCFNGAATSQSRNRSPRRCGCCRGLWRFNGAATSQSRNPCRRRSSPSHRRCFNGAATSQSRNRRGGDRQADRCTASMGPRLRSRGIIRERPGCPKTRYKLQWGRDFAVAESRPGGPRRGGDRGFNGAATSQSRNPPMGCQPGGAGSASMGPRLRSRGILTKLRAVTGLSKLQWGRDFAVAESTQPHAFRASQGRELQWGRDFAVAESAPGIGRRRAG